MENMEITVNMNNLNEDERGKLVALVEKANKPVLKVWKPEKEEIYYYIKSNGGVTYTNWVDWTVDETRYALGDCFHTREEAEFAVEKLKVAAELKRFAEEHNEGKIDWKHNNANKYYAYYSHNSAKIYIEFAYSNHLPGIYFASREIVEQAIEAIGADRLKKYYFEVED